MFIFTGLGRLLEDLFTKDNNGDIIVDINHNSIQVESTVTSEINILLAMFFQLTCFLEDYDDSQKNRRYSIVQVIYCDIRYKQYHQVKDLNHRTHNHLLLQG